MREGGRTSSTHRITARKNVAAAELELSHGDEEEVVQDRSRRGRGSSEERGQPRRDQEEQARGQSTQEAKGGPPSSPSIAQCGNQQ